MDSFTCDCAEGWTGEICGESKHQLMNKYLVYLKDRYAFCLRKTFLQSITLIFYQISMIANLGPARMEVPVSMALTLIPASA